MPLSQEQLEQESRSLERGLDGPLNYKPMPYEKALKGDNLYIFSVFPEEFKIAKGSLGTFRIPACPIGARVSDPCVIPAWPKSSYYDAANNCMRTWSDEGAFVAQDIVHPQIGNDWSYGQNYDDYGVFWTANKIPTDAEISAANKKRDDYFRRMLAEATKLEIKGQLDLIHPHMRLAASHFQEDRPWNKIYKKMAECAACGGPMKEGIVVHSCGAVYDWPKAIALGLRTKEQAEAAGIVLAEKPGKKTSQSV